MTKIIHTDPGLILLNHTARFSVTSLTQRFPEPETIPESGADWVLVSGTNVAITRDDPPRLYVSTNPKTAGCTVETIRYLGHRNEIPVYAAEIAGDSPLPPEMKCAAVRQLFGHLPDDELAVAAYAVRIIEFVRTNRYCGRCGAKTRQLRTERAQFCTDCNLIIYPRISPAIIVLVQNGNRILLAQSPHFPVGMHSIIAGFVEPGETLEQTLHREVKEEVGITVKNLRYIASKPWPFPNSLMCGFVAEYDEGEIAIDNNEIVAASWFDRDHLPMLPPPLMSLSRALIDAWVRREV
jgi:NAD+ diphosphatase